MKLIIDKDTKGFETKEFREYLKTPCSKTEITQKEADELRTQLEEGMKPVSYTHLTLPTKRIV